MEVLAYSLLISTFLVCATVLARARYAFAAGSVAARKAPRLGGVANAGRAHTPAADGDVATGELTLLERVERIERALPAYQLEMQAIADQAQDMLDSAEKKRRRADMAARRAQGREASEAGPGGIEGGSPEFQPPLDPSEHRAAILAEVRRRRGQLQ